MVFLVIGIYLVLEGYQLHVLQEHAVGPATLPMFIGFMLILLSAATKPNRGLNLWQYYVIILSLTVVLLVSKVVIDFI